MTKSRVSAGRILLGLLGSSSKRSTILREWNRYLKEQDIDGSMDCYPCTAETLPERLSEMVHFDRRGYIVTASLQHSIVPCMDHMDASTKASGAVDSVVNNEGVLLGYWTGNNDEMRKDLWFGQEG